MIDFGTSYLGPTIPLTTNGGLMPIAPAHDSLVQADGAYMLCLDVGARAAAIELAESLPLLLAPDYGLLSVQ